ncbi:MAG: hypothetical protein WCN86_03260 [bacterium]
MKNLNRHNSFSFRLIATAIILTLGLYLAISIPNLKSWRDNQIDKLLSEANKTNSPATKQALLAQAGLIGIDDPIATGALANNFWQAGNYLEAIKAYEQSWLRIDKAYLGGLALRADQPVLAKRLFNESNQAGESSEALAGLAVVEYIAGNTQRGCEYADRSQKLNLSSTVSERANAICLIVQNKSRLTPRQQTYLLLDAHMYRLALTRLEATDPKANDDWQSIAKIYANTGQLDKAIAALDGGLDQSPSNQALLELKVRYLLVQGKDAEAKPLQTQLNEMKFAKFQLQ